MLHWPRDTLSPQKLALTSPTSRGHSVGIVRSWTKTTELFIIIIIIHRVSTGNWIYQTLNFFYCLLAIRITLDSIS
jgi:hypothetical protein